jgi:hypothetical protein
MKTAALIMLLVSGALVTRSQSIFPATINVSGNSFSNADYSIDWSIGELVAVHTATSSDGFVVITNGLLQPNLPAANNSLHFTKDEISILPNPTYGRIQINIQTRQQGNISIIIYDADGRKITAATVVSNGVGTIKHFDLSALAAGPYFIKIDLDPTGGSVRKTGSYKIVKL